MKKTKIILIITIFLLIIGIESNAQRLKIDGQDMDETFLYSQTKQVNQFFRRFNNEEDFSGKRYDTTDTRYRANDVRKEYLSMLFNNQNSAINNTIKQRFIQTITNDTCPHYIDFHANNWFAEVSSIFIWQGKETKLTMFLKLQEENLGYKWVISNIYFEPFNTLFFNTDTAALKVKFIHPLSHEVEFMTLRKIFENNINIEYYTYKYYQPDYLTLFLYEIKKGNLRFKTIENVKFHFFQVPDWYFELTWFSRPGNNTGWLISNISEISDKQKYMLMKLIFRN